MVPEIQNTAIHCTFQTGISKEVLCLGLSIASRLFEQPGFAVSMEISAGAFRLFSTLLTLVGIGGAAGDARRLATHQG